MVCMTVCINAGIIIVLYCQTTFSVFHFLGRKRGLTGYTVHIIFTYFILLLNGQI